MILSGFDGAQWQSGGSRKVYEDNLDNGLPYWLTLNAGASFTQGTIGSVGGMTLSPDSNGVIELAGPDLDLGIIRGAKLEVMFTGGAGGGVEIQMGFFSESSGVLARQGSSDNYVLLSGVAGGIMNRQTGYYELLGTGKRFNPCVQFDTKQETLFIGDCDQISAARVFASGEYTKTTVIKPRIKFINASGGFTRRIHHIKLTLDWV
ncbi:hypothetical protein [Flyfo siphovirus Tbat2_3]|nr:hypothetical protein [Flyfo siphovirus Tbat2_3]